MSRSLACVWLVALVVGCATRRAPAPVPQAAVRTDFEALIGQMVLSQEPAVDTPIHTPSVDTPADDRRMIAYSAAAQLGKCGQAAFPSLLRHLNDPRQSICLRPMLPCTLGLACFTIIEGQIFALPPSYHGSFGRRGADGEYHDRPLWLFPRLFAPDTITDWLATRQGRPLVDLQIEALEWLIAEEMKIGFETEADRAEIVVPLQQQLDRLRADRASRPPLDGSE